MSPLQRRVLVAACAAVLSSTVLAGSWRYSRRVDEMNDREGVGAMVTSTNQLKFSFPYQGRSTGFISLRQWSGEDQPTLMLAISRGQFICADECKLRIRFDEGELATYTASPPSDGSADTVFIDNVSGFLDELKKAKRLRVQATFFQEGDRILNFDVAGLAWPPPPGPKKGK